MYKYYVIKCDTKNDGNSLYLYKIVGKYIKDSKLSEGNIIHFPLVTGFDTGILFTTSLDYAFNGHKDITLEKVIRLKNFITENDKNHHYTIHEVTVFDDESWTQEKEIAV